MSRLQLTFAMRPGLLGRLFTPDALGRLAEVSEFEPVALDRLDTAAAGSVLARTEVLVTGWGSPPLTSEILAAAPRLAAVIHAAGSVKHHLPTEFWARGIPVSTAAAANAGPVAEYTLAAILFANKAVLPIAAAYRKHPQDLDLELRFPAVGNYGKRIGVVGASRIGRRVIELLRPFDLDVAVADPYLTPDDAAALEVTQLGLDELVATADVVSLHAPDLPSTRHLLDRRRLGLMRDGATIVNTARPALVDQDALIEELVSGRLNAVLDLTVPERLPQDSPLFGLPNVLVTPHIAGSMGVELTRLGDTAVDEVHRIAAGLPLLHPVAAQHLERSA